MYVVCYDVTSDSIRAKISKELENYGIRVQYSVFQCELDKKRFEAMYHRLDALLNEKDAGNIMIFCVCENCRKNCRIIGKREIKKQYCRDEVIVI